MLNPLVCQNLASQVADDLVNIDNHAPLFIGCEVQGFDMGVNHAPLARPILAHAIMAVYIPAFHAIRPNHTGCIPAKAASMSRVLNAIYNFLRRSRFASIVISFLSGLLYVFSRDEIYLVPTNMSHPEFSQ